MSATFLGDLKNASINGNSLVPAVRSASANGTGVDLLLADGPVHVIVNVGAQVGGVTSAVFTLEESDDNSTFVAVQDQANTGTTANLAAGTLTAVLSHWLRSKRYVRVVYTQAGGTSTANSATVLARKRFTGTGGGAQTT